MQCIFDQKMAKTAKIRTFPVTKLLVNYTKQLSPVSDQVLDNSDARFRKNVQKPDFLAKMTKFWTKKGSKNGPNFFVRA